MRTALLATLLLLAVISANAQQDRVFKVKKPADSLQNEKQYQRLYKLNLFAGVDTLYMMGSVFDFSEAAGLYDSISTFNMRYKLYGGGKYIELMTGKFEGIGMLKLFRKKEDGTMELFYLKNFYIRQPRRRW